MILMGMGQHHRSEAPALEERKVGRGQRPGRTRVHARIKEDTNPAGLEQVAICPDLLGSCQVGEFHQVKV